MTPASDIYSLGVIGYEMLAGHPPFTAGNAGAVAMAHVHQPPPPLPPTVPAAVRAAIFEALSKDPADRPRDAHAFASRLRRLQLAGMPPPERPAEAEIAGGQPTLLADRADTADTDESHGTIASTQLMTDIDDGSRTAVMPPGAIVGRTPDVGLSQQPYAARRQRRAPYGTRARRRGRCRDRPGAVDWQRPGNPPRHADDVVDAEVRDRRSECPCRPARCYRPPICCRRLGSWSSWHQVEAPGVAGGVVISVAPSGQVPSGATVTLDVSNDNLASTTTTVAKHGKGKPKGKPKG